MQNFYFQNFQLRESVYMNLGAQRPNGIVGCQDDSIELGMTRIGPAVVEFEHPQNLGARREFPKGPDEPLTIL